MSAAPPHAALWALWASGPSASSSLVRRPDITLTAPAAFGTVISLGSSLRSEQAEDIERPVVRVGDQFNPAA